MVVGLSLVVAIGAAAVITLRYSADAVPPSPASAAAPVPVTTSVVEIGDFPIDRVVVGTVQVYNTVTVRVRVDGEVQTITFREGQDVHAGDLLAQIDPRTYAAQLHQTGPTK